MLILIPGTVCAPSLCLSDIPLTSINQLNLRGKLGARNLKVGGTEVAQFSLLVRFEHNAHTEVSIVRQG